MPVASLDDIAGQAQEAEWEEGTPELTPEDLDRRHKVQQLIDEQNRARAMNEPPLTFGGVPGHPAYQGAVGAEPEPSPAPSTGGTASFNDIAEPVSGTARFDDVVGAAPPPQTSTPETDKALAEYGADFPTGEELTKAGERAEAESPFLTGAGQFLTGAGQQVAANIPQTWGSAGKMAGDIALQSISPITGEDIQTARNIGKVIKGAGIEQTFQEKPFTEYTSEDWGKFIAQRGIDAAMAIPLFRALHPSVRANIIRAGGETDASRIRSTTQVPQLEVRPQVGKETPLRQQGGTAGIREEPVPAAAGGEQEPGSRVGDVVAGEAQEVLPGTRLRTIESQLPEVGISRARTEAELGEGSVEPGAGGVLGEGLEYGRDYIRKGGDPRLPIRRAKASGVAGQNDVGIVHAELERLRGERAKASKAFEKNPDDPVLGERLAAADHAQRAWRKELQPVLTALGKGLREAYAVSLPEGDPATMEGLTNLFDEHFKGERDITPQMRTAMAKAVKGVKEMREGANAKMKGIEDTLVKQMKGKKVMTPKELDADLRGELETQFSDCILR